MPSPPRPTTVLTVDDQAIFRRTLASLVEAAPGFVQVGEAASGTEALALTAELRPDLVLLDVRMSGLDGIETAQRLAAAHPRVAIVLISIDDVPELAAANAPPRATFVRKQDLSISKLDEIWVAIGNAS